MPTVYQLALSAILFTVLLTGYVLSPRVATAATYYVATTGSNTNPGSQSQPFRTIDQGVSVLRAGDTLYIRQGTYTNQSIGCPSEVPVPSGTSWSNAVTIAGYPGETVTLTGYHVGLCLFNVSYLIVDNLIIDASRGGNSGIFFNCDVHHIRFQNGEVKNSPDDTLVFGCGSHVEVLNSKIHNAAAYGFYWGGQDSVFDGNEVYDNAGFAFHIYSAGSTAVNNNIVSNNVIHGNGFGYLSGANIYGGLIISHGTGNQVDNNIIYDNFAGIGVDYGCTNCQVSNNIIYNNASYGINIGAGAVNTIVEDNIVYQNGDYDIADYGGGTVLRNNAMTPP
jgi:parallel beta-helix repeat protein